MSNKGFISTTILLATSLLFIAIILYIVIIIRNYYLQNNYISNIVEAELSDSSLFNGILNNISE